MGVNRLFYRVYFGSCPKSPMARVNIELPLSEDILDFDLHAEHYLTMLFRVWYNILERYFSYNNYLMNIFPASFLR